MSEKDERRKPESSNKPQDERQMTLEELIEHCKAKGLTLVRASEISPQEPASDDE